MCQTGSLAVEHAARLLSLRRLSTREPRALRGDGNMFEILGAT